LYPMGFVWPCCGRKGDEVGCWFSRHVSDSWRSNLAERITAAGDDEVGSLSSWTEEEEKSEQERTRRTRVERRRRVRSRTREFSRSCGRSGIVRNLLGLVVRNGGLGILGRFLQTRSLLYLPRVQVCHSRGPNKWKTPRGEDNVVPQGHKPAKISFTV